MFFFFKQKTAYEMRISDWSSDVCSSDLKLAALDRVRENIQNVPGGPPDVLQPRRVLDQQGEFVPTDAKLGIGGRELRQAPGDFLQQQIGRASCRERVCQYV